MAQAIEETAAVAAEEGEVAVAAEGVGGAFGYLGGLAEGAAALAPTAGEYPLQPLPDTACQVTRVDQAEGRAPRACPSGLGDFTPQPFLDTACQVALVRQEEGFAPRACLNPRQTRSCLTILSHARCRCNSSLTILSARLVTIRLLHCTFHLDTHTAIQLSKFCHSHAARALPSAMEHEDTLDAIHTTLALDIEVYLDEICCILARIRFLCHVSALCLVAIALCEGLWLLAKVWDTALFFVALMP